MSSTFRIWLSLSRTPAPRWSDTGFRILNVQRFAADGYDVTVEGDGTGFTDATVKLPGVSSIERLVDGQTT